MIFLKNEKQNPRSFKKNTFNKKYILYVITIKYIKYVIILKLYKQYIYIYIYIYISYILLYNINV